MAHAIDTDGLTHVSTGLCPGCAECASDHDMSLDCFAAAYDGGCLCDEPYFSWGGCDTCDTTLGGSRHTAHGVDSDGAIVHLGICEDCFLGING